MINLLISNLLLFGNLLIYFSKLFQKKRNIYFILVIYGVCVMVSTLLHVSLDTSFKTIVIMCMILLCGIACYTGSYFKKMLALFSFFVIYLLAELISANILLLITGIDATIEKSSYYFMLGIIASNLLVILFTYMITNLFKVNLKKEIPTYSWIILILPITTIALVLNLDSYVTLMKEQTALIIIIFGFVLSNIMTIFIFFKVISYIEYKNANVKIKLKESYLKSSYNLLEQQYNQSFSFLHDILKKSITLQNLLNSKDFDVLSTELDSLTKKTFKEFNMLYTNSDIINTIVNSKLNLLLNNNIDFRCTIEYNDFSFLKFTDQFSLFSNLLDFSIKSCIKSVSDSKTIVFKTELINDRVKIQLLYSKSDIYQDNEYNTFMKYIDTLKKKYKVLYSLENDFLSNSDSFIIVFDLQNKKYT